MRADQKWRQHRCSSTKEERNDDCHATGLHDEEIRFAVGQTSLGAILVASSAKGVASILLGDDPDALVRNLQDRFPDARLIGADRDYENWSRGLSASLKHRGVA